MTQRTRPAICEACVMETPVYTVTSYLQKLRRARQRQQAAARATEDERVWQLFTAVDTYGKKQQQIPPFTPILSGTEERSRRPGTTDLSKPA